MREIANLKLRLTEHKSEYTAEGRLDFEGSGIEMRKTLAKIFKLFGLDGSVSAEEDFAMVVTALADNFGERSEQLEKILVKGDLR